MHIRNYREIQPEPTGVEGLTVRWGITASQGATNFSMRLLELEPLKSTPMHQHDSEHEIFVLVGRGEVVTEGAVYPIRDGSIIYVAPNEIHQFRNTGASILRMVDAVMFPSRIVK
ncbi:MAG: cupin domain-containing protein [Chloroflexi bacterium]|jgi:quercetin dioxygenase-like cupin family protein|nr:cupin domain-containing protein [Chloroflexota bacterium]